MKRVLITGSAGFIGFHLAKGLLDKGFDVWGIDGFTNYYDVKLKRARNDFLKKSKNFVSKEGMIENQNFLDNIFSQFRPEIVFHLAAQAGVRYSLDNPRSYLESNLVGTFNLLETVRSWGCSHFLMASTSSIYGSNTSRPYKEVDKADTPLSFYAATKKSCELITHSYSHLHGIPITCFRFFTVFGPWGRPDMALFKFTDAILKNEPLEVFNNGHMERDFTYVDDLIYAIIKLSEILPNEARYKNSNLDDDDNTDFVTPWRVVNIGSSKPIKLMDFITNLERALGMKAKKNFLPLQKGDVFNTYADISLLESLIGPVVKTDLKQGIDKFLSWYFEYYKVNKIKG